MVLLGVAKSTNGKPYVSLLEPSNPRPQDDSSFLDKQEYVLMEFP